MITSETILGTSDGQTLQARWDDPEGLTSGTVVLCHPHPLQGGTMRAPLMDQVATGLVERGYSVLRFNFRGVGESSGTHDFGNDELADIDAAWAVASRDRSGPFGLAGWSFGAATSLVWLARTGLAVPWVGVAPPVKGERSPVLPTELPSAPRTFIIGDRDQFTTVSETRAYAAKVSGIVEVIKGSDHFFYFRERIVADLMADAFQASAAGST